MPRSSRRIVSVFGALGAALALSAMRPASAQAGVCGTFTMSAGARIAVFGKVQGTSHAGVCEYGPSGYCDCQPFPACTSGSDFLEIVGNELSNMILPYESGMTPECPADLGFYLDPFSSLSGGVSLLAEGRGGCDTIHGTNKADMIFTNNGGGAADGSWETVCAYGGNDLISGDQDNPDYPDYDFEWLDGGAGTADACYANGSAPYTDVAWNCELVVDGIDAGPYGVCESTMGSWDLIRESVDDDPWLCDE